ncbi:Pentatricopeptide repeat-containing protein [Abeliophyllum distichum]|uniref:Pentatricopeptide repeat-containing protein n=1 Tax=Abeliophyllum distichum TaxID=126358 RepID=A0ABD1RVQ8_9LAMI
MYCKRATLVTFNSLRNLSKVCKTRSLCCVESSKALPFARNLSTATERSDFYNANYMNSDDNSSDYSNYNQVNGFNGGMSDGFNAEGSRTSQQLHSGVYGQASLESMSGKFQQSSSGYGMLPGGLDSMSGQSQQSSSGFYGGQYGNLQQNSGGHYAGNTGIYQQSLHNAEIGQSEQSSSVYYGGQYGMPQQNSGGHYAGNTGTYQQSIHNVGIHKQNKSGVNYSNAGNHWQKWNESQNEGMVVSQVTKDFKQNEESVEFAEGKQSRNTIEELDGFCEEGKLKEAVELLGLLEQEHVQVDLPRYVMLMKACGENKALQEAKSVHEHLMRSMPHLEVKTHNKILEMYSNCGSMDDAFVVFDQMPKRNLTSWDIMISGLAENGLEEDSIELFAEFKRSGLKPDGQMFIGVFSVCGVLGDIVEGMLHFESMSKDYGIPASMEHYVSVVAMLGTAGCLDEALEFIEQMPIEPVVEIWETLMNFCRIHGHTVLGDRCAELVELLDPSRVNEQSRVGLIPIKASDLAGEKKEIEWSKSARCLE